MTAKDFALIAAAIADTRTNGAFTDSFEFQHALNKLAMKLGSALSANNPRFDYDRFMLACNTPRQATTNL